MIPLYVGKENVTKLRNLYVAAAKTNKGGVCNIFRAEGGRIGFVNAGVVGDKCMRNAINEHNRKLKEGDLGARKKQIKITFIFFLIQILLVKSSQFLRHFC